MICSGSGRSALRAARAGRSSSRAAAASARSALAEPLPLGLLPPHPRSVRGASRLARRPVAAASRHAGGRSNSSSSGVAVAVAQRPFHACGVRAAAGGGLGEGGWGASAGGKDGDEESSSSSSDSSSDSDSGDDNDEAEGSSPPRAPPSAGTGATAPSALGGDSEKGTEARDSRGASDDAAGAAADSGKSNGGDAVVEEGLREGAGGRWDDAGAEDAEGGGYDYRRIGSELYENGDLEAGETMQGMYDFVDDIVETQHVPTIQDPFDHKGRFHRCPGKRQGKAALPSTCQIFDIKELHVNHTPLLKRFTNDAGMILGRYRTGLCAKCQRKVARTIKAARQMGFVPTVSDHEIRDTGPGGLFAWAGKDGDHDAMAKAKAKAEATRQKDEKKRFGSLA